MFFFFFFLKVTFWFSTKIARPIYKCVIGNHSVCVLLLLFLIAKNKNNEKYKQGVVKIHENLKRDIKEGESEK